MPNCDNLSPYAAASLPSMLPDGSDILLFVISARFHLPAPGRSGLSPLVPCEDQQEVQLVDEYMGAPDASSLKIEGQTAPFRPATDVLMLGQAHAPKGRALKRVDVGLSLSPYWTKTIAVFGERVYTQGVGAIVPTSPRPFVSMPLVYERAFGGAEPGNASIRAFEARNPVGRGFFRSGGDALDQPVPNLEDPGHLIHSSASRPRPMAFGPIARSWQPRVGFGGTYDQHWVEELAPAWPPDFDPRFFQAAPPDQQVPGYLKGGELIGLSGVHPDGDMHFELPTLRLLLKGYFRERAERRLMVMDSVLLQPDEGLITLGYRASLRLPKGMFDYQHSIIRVLEDWEEAPQ